MAIGQIYLSQVAIIDFVRCLEQCATTNLELPQALLLALVCILVAEGQQNNRRPSRRQNRPRPRQNNRNRGLFGRNGVTRNGARDARGTEVYPGCSGKVCLPEAQLCAERKQKVSFLQSFLG